MAVVQLQYKEYPVNDLCVSPKPKDLQKGYITHGNKMDEWMEQCFTSPPTQYRLYGRRFLQVKRPNQQHQSTEGTHRLHN